MDNKDERVMLLDNLIDSIKYDSITIQLILKKLDLMKFENMSKEELKLKLVELLQLASKIKVIESLCLNGLVKL